MYTTVIIEDDPMITRLNRRYIEQDSRFAVVQTFSAAHPALFWLRRNPIDLIVLDVYMPQMSGTELLLQLRAEGVDADVIMVTSANDAKTVNDAVRLGAVDYLVKPFSFAELNARIKALLRRPGTETAVVAPLLACGDLELNYASRRARRGTEEVDLTEKEFRLLEFLMQNQGAALSRQVLLKNVWERDFETNTNVVDVYVNYLRGKVDRDPARRLIHTVVGIGYMMQAK